MQGLSSRRGVSLHCKANAKAQGGALLCVCWGASGLGDCSLGGRELPDRPPPGGPPLCPCGRPSPAGGTSSVWLRDSGWQLRGVETSGRPTRGLCGSSWQGSPAGAGQGLEWVPPPTMLRAQTLPRLWARSPSSSLSPAVAPWQLRNVKRCLSLSKWPERAPLLCGVWGQWIPKSVPRPRL